jgi:hypothetical protein
MEVCFGFGGVAGQTDVKVKRFGRKEEERFWNCCFL